jgi:uncharacterized membrane protein
MKVLLPLITCEVAYFLLQLDWMASRIHLSQTIIHKFHPMYFMPLKFFSAMGFFMRGREPYVCNASVLILYLVNWSNSIPEFFTQLLNQPRLFLSLAQAFECRLCWYYTINAFLYRLVLFSGWNYNITMKCWYIQHGVLSGCTSAFFQLNLVNWL